MFPISLSLSIAHQIITCYIIYAIIIDDIPLQPSSSTNIEWTRHPTLVRLAARGNPSRLILSYSYPQSYPSLSSPLAWGPRPPPLSPQVEKNQDSMEMARMKQVIKVMNQEFQTHDDNSLWR